MINVLGFILLLILFVFIYVSVKAYRIYRSFRDMAKRFTGSKGRDDGYGRESRTHRTDGDEIIIDRRSSEEANRKILSKSEGEYVDFEETK